MNEYLNRQLDQINKLISSLKGTDVDLDKLAELNRSLEVLSHQIKTARFAGFDEQEEQAGQGEKQDAAFFYDDRYRVVRFVGSYRNIFERDSARNLPSVKSFFRATEFEHFQKKTELLLETGEPQSFYSEIISKNGLLLPVHFLLERVSFGQEEKMMAAGMVFYSQNPSDLEDYREILMENLPGIDVYLFDNQFRYVLAGGREKKRLGLNNTDFPGKTLFDLFDEKIQKRLFPFYRNALDGKVTEGEVRIKGHIYFISASPVFGMDESIVGGALISQDVTKEKEVEKNLIRARRQAEEADKAKSLFLASMSHEIRTPLNAIIGFTELLSKIESSPRQRKFIQLINQSSEHLLSVVNEVLFLFKLDMGKVYIEQVPFNIREMIRNIYESLLFRAREKELEFEFNIDPELPEVLVGDPFRVKQILINLFGNAIKFTDEGKVTVGITIEKETRKKIFVRCDVEDTGIGIPKEDLNAIFDEFSQSYAGKEKKRRGAGLGLTIVQKLVHLLDGRIHVESEVNKGSKFTVVIPFKRSDSGAPLMAERKFSEKYNLLEEKRILYADDDENNILLAESILTDWKVSYELAYDGIEAMEILKKQPFDVALLDIQMPGLSGVEIIKRVKADKMNPNFKTKMLAVTANIMEEDLKTYLESGFDDFILKPFRAEKLYNKICTLLDLEYLSPPNDLVTSDHDNNESTEAFDSSLLSETSGGDPVFFNKMIDTFIDAGRNTCYALRTGAQAKNRKIIREQAHKIMPGLRFFGLNLLANELAGIIEMVRNNKSDGSVEKHAVIVAGKIENVLQEAEKAKFPKEGI
jgi:signal transduction histidine kinase/DNA-binding NarL/FixJ family response regulator